MSKLEVINRKAVVATVEYLDGNNKLDSSAICITELASNNGIEVIVENSALDDGDVTFALSWQVMDKLVKMYKKLKQ